MREEIEWLTTPPFGNATMTHKVRVYDAAGLFSIYLCKCEAHKGAK